MREDYRCVSPMSRVRRSLSVRPFRRVDLSELIQVFDFGGARESGGRFDRQDRWRVSAIGGLVIGGAVSESVGDSGATGRER